MTPLDAQVNAQIANMNAHPLPPRHGAAALMVAPRLHAMRAAMRDTSLLQSTRRRAADWLALHGLPRDQHAATDFLRSSPAPHR